MKRFAVAFLLMALILGSLAAKAASATFATRNGEIFQFYLNGRLLNGRGTSQVIIDRLPAGPQNVEFRIPGRRGVLTYCTNVFLNRGFETNYILTIPGRNPNFFLREVGRRPLYPQVACSTCPAAPRPHGHGVYDDYDGYGNHGNGYQNGPNQGGNNYNQGNYNQGNYNNNAPGYGNNYNNQPNNVMSTYDVDLLTESMRRKSFDNAKADIAKQALSNQLIQAEDVKKIMQQFSFESNRLDFAKFVYAKVYDQQNFYRVYDAFEFDSSATEMQRWLKR